jgi:gliding motility-associated lipoprotein GldH
MITACGDNYFYAKSKTVQDQAWYKEEEKAFVFEVMDTTETYNFIINLRNTTDYEFQNLFLFMNTVYPDQSTSRDTIELILARPDGKWLGKGSGFYRDNLFLFKKNVKMPEAGKYRIEFIQAMRRDTLYGVDEIGLRIQKHLPQS